MPTRNDVQKLMRSHLILRFFSFVFVLTIFSAGCFVTAPPDVRGWQCSEDSDCTEGYECVRERCRPLCQEDGDCQSALKEHCGKLTPDATKKYCLPPCLPGEKRRCYTGPPKTKNIGICKEGIQICDQQNRWGPCQGEVLPREEDCSGTKDENCDGRINENCTCLAGTTRSCYTGTLKTRKIGACKDGTQTCSKEGKWGKCQGEVLPTKEACNNIDDDCDGSIDEGLNDNSCSVPDKKGLCAKGKTRCQNGQFSCVQVNFPTTEMCNGIDDDCDGIIDNNPNEGAYTLTRVCYTESKGCLWNSHKRKYECTPPCRIGYNKCLKNHTWGSTCFSEMTPKKEDCNGIDDDCNGIVDDKIDEVGQPCEDKNKKGICRKGHKICKNGHIFCQTTTPSSEICDGKDNDCNGKIDDNASCPAGKTCKQGSCQ